jgi:hypothetical protein
MPPAAAVGTKLKQGKLLRRLESLDIDEGIRIETRKGDRKEKLFVNRRPSGTFVVQLDNSQEFEYFDSAFHAVGFVRDRAGKGATAWLY